MTISSDRALELIDQIEELENELTALVEKRERRRGYSWVRGKPRFSNDSLAEHTRQRIPVATYVIGSRLAVFLTSPLIYVCLFPLLLSDLALTIYQKVCFPIYGVPLVRRSDYFVMDRGKLQYLNFLERLNCRYCSYATGLLAYEIEIVGRTEQHWCPIKHAKAIRTPHSRYRRFLNFGAALDYRRNIETLRRDFSDLNHDGKTQSRKGSKSKGKFMLTSIQRNSSEFLTKHSLEPVCAAPGPFITVYLPARHPGAADLSRTERLNKMIQASATDLKDRRYQGPVDPLLEPFDELVGNPSMRAGGGHSVVFGSPGGFWHFQVAFPVDERLVVASHPHITPLLPDLVADREFYLLALNKKRLRLARDSDGKCMEVSLPDSVPINLERFGNFDQPDHDLENRSAAGPSTGQMRGVHFGTSAEHEQAYLHDWFRLVDRELTPLLGGAPLVLFGVSYELAAYRRAAKYPCVLEADSGNPGLIVWPDLAIRARKSVMAKQALETRLALAYFRETNRRDRVVSGVREVLESAYEGRVHKLLLAKDSESADLLGPLYPIGQAHLEGAQDMLNAAAVETIRRGGETHILSPAELGAAGPVAAILRYAPGRS